MADPAGAKTRAVTRMIAHRLTTVAVEVLKSSFVAITPEAPGFHNVAWTSGNKVQIAIGAVFTTRIYAPVGWDAARGRTRIVGFLHGDGLGAAWLRGVKVGDTCDVIGPRRSLNLHEATGPITFLGDETSIGLACGPSQQHGMLCSSVSRAAMPTRCVRPPGRSV